VVIDSKLYSLDTLMDELRGLIGGFPEHVLRDYQEKLDVSWLFHDHALEGVVLSYSELKAAIDTRIISDVSLIPMYEDVKNQKIVIDFIRESVQQRKPPEVNLELMQRFCEMLAPNSADKASVYRKENPLHRLYYHEISQPEKIPGRMKQYAEWLVAPETQDLHPIVRATQAQRQLLSVYPWTKNSGKVARLMSNYMLILNGYLPAIVHSIERQRYYDALRHDDDALLTLIMESLQNSIETSLKFFQELKGLSGRRRAG